jgi:2-polyprenyl-3-methyl-5-hydroxy-6-metoxy-1,4-benzoquinol methylase
MNAKEFLGQFKQIFVTKKFKFKPFDNDSYWDSRLTKKNTSLNNFQKNRINFVVGSILEGDELIDIGCGTGEIAEKIKIYKNVKIIGMDDSDLVHKSMEKKNIEFVKSSISIESIDDLSDPDYFLFLEVLEHIPNPEEILFKAIQKSRKGVFISVPNSGYFIYRLRLLFGRFPIQWKIFPGEHLRFWTIKDMNTWIKCLNLSVEKKSFYEGLPILNKLFPNLFAMGQIYKLKKID